MKHMNQTLTDDIDDTRSTWPELLTPEEAAMALRADVDTVLSAVDMGWINALQLGPHVRIPRRELVAAPLLER